MKNINNKSIFYSIFFLILFSYSINTYAEEGDKKAVINLTFDQNDSERICRATVMADGMPLNEKEVHFYVKRSYSLLPVDKAVETDSSGVAQILYPSDLPGDKNGNLIVVARIEDDDDFGTVESEATVKWGVQPSGENDWGKRSLSASRNKAPTVLILVSNTIIAFIWGTIVYVIYLLVKISRNRRRVNAVKK